MGALVLAVRRLERIAIELMATARADRDRLKQLEERLGRQGQ